MNLTKSMQRCPAGPVLPVTVNQSRTSLSTVYGNPPFLCAARSYLSGHTYADCCTPTFCKIDAVTLTVCLSLWPPCPARPAGPTMVLEI